MRTSLRLFLLLVCALVATGTVPRAAAEPTPTPPPSTSTTTPDTPTGRGDPTGTADNLTFGIGPALPVPATQTVDGRPYLNYLASPGATVRDEVALLNLSNEPVTLDVYATDALQAADGAFGLLPADEAPVDAGSWFTLDVPRSGKITVPARTGKKYGRVTVPMTARIPADAEPGDHVAGVVASLVTVGKNKDGARIKFDQRLGIRTYFRISGPVTPRLEIDNLDTTYASDNNLKGTGTVTVSYDIRNTGNVRMYTSQLVTIDRWRRDPVLRYPAPVADILPGATIHVTELLDGFSIGKVTSQVTLVPKPVDPEIPRGDLVQAEDEVWAWPWLLIAVVAGVLLLLLLGGALWWRRRRKRRRAAAASGPRTGRTGAGRAKGRRVKGDPVPVGRSAAYVAGLAAALLAALVAVSGAPATADDSDTSGHLIVEPGQPTGDPANALTEGFWGHEGSGHDQASVVMADLSGGNGKVTDKSQAAWIKHFGTADFNSVGIAFVKASKDGSAERPAVEQGQNAGQVFEWFSNAPIASPWVGNDADARDDIVVPVSTLEEYQAWVQDGRPDQVPNDDLELIDALEPGTPVADHPMGRSIQNRWPAGEQISLVAFRYDGFDANGIPIVHRGKDGHAVTAWLTFRTVADPDDPDVRTSAGYEVVSTSDLPDEGGNGGANDVGDGGQDDAANGGKHGDRNGPGAGQRGAGAGADGSSPAASGADDDTEASWSNLWTGSGLAMPLLALALVLAFVLAAGTSLLRDKSNTTSR